MNSTVLTRFLKALRARRTDGREARKEINALKPEQAVYPATHPGLRLMGLRPAVTPTWRCGRPGHLPRLPPPDAGTAVTSCSSGIFYKPFTLRMNVYLTFRQRGFTAWVCPGHSVSGGGEGGAENRGQGRPRVSAGCFGSGRGVPPTRSAPHRPREELTPRRAPTTREPALSRGPGCRPEPAPPEELNTAAGGGRGHPHTPHSLRHKGL